MERQSKTARETLQRRGTNGRNGGENRLLVSCTSLTLAEFTKGKLPFIQRVAYSTFRIDAYDREVACVSSKEPQGEGSLKFYCGFSIVLKLFLQW